MTMDVSVTYHHSADLTIKATAWNVSKDNPEEQKEQVMDALQFKINSTAEEEGDITKIGFNPTARFLLNDTSELGVHLLKDADIDLYWVTTVAIYEKDSDNLPPFRHSKQQKPLVVMQLISLTPIEKITNMADMVCKERMVLLQPSGELLPADHKFWVICGTMDLFCVPARSAYSCAQTQQLLGLVDLPAADHFGRQLAALPCRRGSLSRAIKAVDTAIRSDPKQAEQWSKLMEVAMFKLDGLSRSLAPQQVIPEAARRLVINELASCASCAADVQYAVDRPQEGRVGHGVLDYQLLTANGALAGGLIVHCVPNRNNNEEEDDEEEESSDDEQVPKRMRGWKVRPEDREADFEEKHLAQLLYQLYDAVHLDDLKTVMTGVLATQGNDYRFYTLHRAKPDQQLATVVYHGQLAMQVYRRPAHKADAEEARKIVQAMVAAVRGDLVNSACI